jgi:hypothetical protein
MNKIFKYIPALVFIVLLAYSCTKTAAPVISVQIDQAFIQDIIVWDTAGKDVTVTKIFPKPVADVVTGIESIGIAQVNPINIIVTVKTGTNIAKLNVRFILSGQSKFATVNPVLGYIQDCSTINQFTITSLTGKNVNVYAVKVVSQ